jgi:ankyrin repeat protein
MTGAARLSAAAIALGLAWAALSPVPSAQQTRTPNPDLRSGNVAEALLQAVKSGNRSAVQSLVRQKADVNVSDPDGTTALHWAAQVDDREIAQVLIAAGADARRANRYGVTPLQLAAVNGSAPLTKMLLAAGADANAVLPEGETVLMTAARTGRADTLALLIDAGARLDAREQWYGETALMWAAAENHADAVRLLVERGADVNQRSSQMPYKNRRNGQSVLSLGSWTPLMYAARENAVDAARALAAARADLDATDPDGATALVIAIINANYECADAILRAGANPNIVDKDANMGPLYAAADMHRLAVGHGRPNPRPVGALTAVDIATRLLQSKADPNARLKAVILQRHHTAGDSTLGAGATPFMRAAKSGDVDMMKALLAGGADPTLTLPNKTTALMLAAGLGWRDGSPAAPSYDQGTPEEAVEAIQLLLEKGFDINAANSSGDTALHAAITGRASPAIVKYLVEHGANVQAGNQKGVTPLTLATSSRKDLGDIPAILKAAARP